VKCAPDFAAKDSRPAIRLEERLPFKFGFSVRMEGIVTPDDAAAAEYFVAGIVELPR
jgi:hypothetical protein